MSQQSSPLQDFLKHIPDIIKGWLALQPLFAKRRSKTKLSVRSLDRPEEYTSGNFKTIRKTFEVITASPKKQVVTSISIACTQGGDITLETEDGITKILQRRQMEPELVEVELDDVLEQLVPGTTFHLESSFEIRLNECIEQRSDPDPLMPTRHIPRDNTILTLQNVSSFPIRNYIWMLPLSALYPIYRFEMQRGGKRVPDQLIEIRLGWIATLDNEELRELGGYKHDASIFEHFNSGERKQAPKCNLLVRIDELQAKDSVTLAIFHTHLSKRPLGFSASLTG